MAILATIAKPEYNNVINQNPAGSIYAWSASTGVLDANFAGTIGTTDSIQIFTQGYQFAWKPDTVNVIDDTDVMTLLENVNPNATAQVWNNKLTYVGTTASTSDEFVVDGNQLKHSVRMVAPPRLPSGFTGTPKYLAIGGDIGTTAQDWASIDLYADGVSHRSDFVTSDDLSFVEISSGKEIYRIPHITIVDDAGNEYNGQYKLVFGANNVVTMYMLCPWDWLQSATYPIIIDPTVIVSSAYQTVCRPVRLSNNWVVAVVVNGTGLNWYVSKDNGQTWLSLTSIANLFSSGATTYVAMASSGTLVYVLMASSKDTGLVWTAFDATTVATTVSVSASNPDVSTSNGFRGVSLAFDGNGYLHAGYSIYTSTYPNSANIKYSKGTVSGTTVTWSTPVYPSSVLPNGSPGGMTNPCIVVNSNNQPIIFCQYETTASQYYIYGFSYNGTSWSILSVYSGGTYAQITPCAAIDGNGVIDCVWNDQQSSQVAFSSSSDGGTTWTAVSHLPQGGGNYQALTPTITIGSSNKRYVFFAQDNSGGSAQLIYLSKFDGTNWTTVAVTSNSTGNMSNPQALWSEFNMNSQDAVRLIYQDGVSGAVQYYTIALDSPPNAPTLNPVANFDATKATTFSWTFSDPDPGDSQSAFQLQILDVAAGTTVVDTGKTASTNTSYTLTANTLSNTKQYQWRVTTWDSQGQQGPYSAYSTFNTAGAPTTTVTSPSNNSSITTSSLTAQWSYSDPNNYAQQSFQVQLLASDDLTILKDSGTVTSSGNQYTIPYTLANNTTYYVSVRTTNSQGVTSAWASSTFSTSFTPPQQPSVTASALSSQAKITIAMTNYASKNLVLNSGFEVVTTTATLFSDALTSYTGSTVPAPWTLQSGSFSFGAGGATSGANGSLMTAGNAQWKPVLGSDGTTKLALTEQATFTTPATMPTGSYNTAHVDLFVNSTNRYYARVDNGDGKFIITKCVNGTYTDLASVAFTPAVSTTYTITLSLDNTGLLTAKLYSGTGTGGTLLQTLTATDTSLTGGFLIGVGGDTGVVISNASVSAPWANSWTIGGDSRVAWGLTSSAIAGKYSINGVGFGGVGVAQQNYTFNNGTTYTLSGYMSTQNVGNGSAKIYAYMNGTFVDCGAVVGTTPTTRHSATGTGGTGGNNFIGLIIYDSGTVTFDNIQLEQGSLSPYIENDSTSSPQQAPAIAYNDVYRRNTGTSSWTRIATNISASGTYDDYAVASGQEYDYKVTAIGNNGTQVDSAVVSTSVSFTGDWLYNPTSGQQFQFLYNRKAYSLAITEERKEVQTFGSKPMIRRGPLNARTGTLDALMVKIGTGQTPIQQLQAFESDMAPHNAYYLKTAAGEVFKVDIHNAKRSMPAENLNSLAIGVSVDWTEVA